MGVTELFGGRVEIFVGFYFLVFNLVKMDFVGLDWSLRIFFNKYFG